MLKMLVNAMLKHGWTAAELHARIEDAVEWIDQHPNATYYTEETDNMADKPSGR